MSALHYTIFRILLIAGCRLVRKSESAKVRKTESPEVRKTGRPEGRKSGISQERDRQFVQLRENLSGQVRRRVNLGHNAILLIICRYQPGPRTIYSASAALKKARDDGREDADKYRCQRAQTQYEFIIHRYTEFRSFGITEIHCYNHPEIIEYADNGIDDCE